jgi:hypothetical protein
MRVVGTKHLRPRPDAYAASGRWLSGGGTAGVAIA